MNKLVVLVDPGSLEAKSSREGPGKIQEGAAVVDFQDSKSVIRAIQGQVPRWSRRSGSEDHAGLPSLSVPFSAGDCFFKGVEATQALEQGCSTLGGTMNGAYANKNNLVEYSKLHIRGGVCIIRVSNAEHARHQLWLNGWGVLSPKEAIVKLGMRSPRPVPL